MELATWYIILKITNKNFSLGKATLKVAIHADNLLIACGGDEHHEEKAPVKPWVFNQDYTIPSGQRTYTARIDIKIPSDIDTGDYHFMIRLTDRAGWQELKSVSLEIEE